MAPVITMLETLAERGGGDLVTLGVSPSVAAMLDDPYCLSEIHRWTGNWQLRAAELAARPEPWARDLATHEHRRATACLTDLEDRWLRGGSAVLRRLADSGAVEILGGPTAHPFLPILDERLVSHTLRTGLDDAHLRWGTRPAGIWAPECGYRPGLERVYEGVGVDRVMVDGPALHGDTALAHPIGSSSVLAFGRDLDVTYRVWSPKSGYPGDAAYRDFHTFDHASGFRPARVTSRHTAPQDKAPWDRDRAAAAVHRHAVDFVDVVRTRLLELADRNGRPALTVAAYDTELFGHWWYEGPAWLAEVLTLLPQAGVRVRTLAGAAADGLVGEPVEIAESSWGSGKDWRVWTGPQVADLADSGRALGQQLLTTVDAHRGAMRDPVLDQLARETYLALASDWAFMVSKDSAADYACGQVAKHSDRMAALRRAIDTDPHAARTLAARLRVEDGPWGHLDARSL